MNCNLPSLIKLALIAFTKNLHVFQASHSLNKKCLPKLFFKSACVRFEPKPSWLGPPTL